MTSIILAGGENRRLPFNKCLVKIDGVTIIERILHVHEAIFRETIISTNSPEVYFSFGKKMVGDVLEERGPMTGMYSVMSNEDTERFLITPCDTPFLSKDLLQYMAGLETKADAVVPVFHGKPQPFPGVFHGRVNTRLRENIFGKRKSLKRFLETIETFYIDESKVRQYDQTGKSFININTFDDLHSLQGGGLCSDSVSRS